MPSVENWGTVGHVCKCTFHHFVNVHTILVSSIVICPDFKGYNYNVPTFGYMHTYTVPIPITYTVPVPFTYTVPVPFTYTVPIPITYTVPIPFYL